MCIVFVYKCDIIMNTRFGLAWINAFFVIAIGYFDQLQGNIVLSASLQSGFNKFLGGLFDVGIFAQYAGNMLILHHVGQPVGKARGYHCF